MAFTDDEKFRIIRLLGWPANTLNPGALSYNKIIADRLLYIPDIAVGDALDLVDRILQLDKELVEAVRQSGVKKIDDIEFFSDADGTKLQELRRERYRLLMELGATLDITPGPGIKGRLMGNIML